MKRFLSILLAMVMVLSLVACGDKKTPDTPDTPDSPSLRTTAAAPRPSSSSMVRRTSPS